MVERVNPPPHVNIPKKITSDPELAPYHQQVGRILFQLWTRVGGGSSDVISDADDLLSINVSALRGQIVAAAKELDEREAEVLSRLSALSGQVARLSNRLGNMEDAEERLASVQSQLSALRKRIEDLEE